FEELWSVYLPGQNTLSDRSAFCLPSKRRNADGAGVSHDFRSVAEAIGDGSKNSNLSYSHAGSDVSTAKNHPTGCEGQFDQAKAQCGAPGDATSTVTEHDIGGERLWLHQQCADLRRRQPEPKPEPLPEPRKDGPWAGSYLSDQDIKDIESGRAF